MEITSTKWNGTLRTWSDATCKCGRPALRVRTATLAVSRPFCDLRASDFRWLRSRRFVCSWTWLALCCKNFQIWRSSTWSVIREPLWTRDTTWWTGADCIDPARLCDDISSDLTTFKQLFHLYPDRLTLVQYETLASKPMETFESVFKFSGLSVLPSIRQAIQQHTSSHREGARSTFHKSVDRIYQWKSKLNHSQIHHIQTVCSSVMERLGYPRFWIFIIWRRMFMATHINPKDSVLKSCVI